MPPKVDESEVLRDDPDNHRYFQTWGERKSNGVAAARSEKEDAKKEDIAEILRAHSEGTKLDPQLIAWLQNTAEHRDGLAAKLAEASAKNPTADLAELITAVKGLLPPTAAPSSSDKASDTLAIIAALKNMQPPPQDLLAVLRQAKELFAPVTTVERGHDDLARLDQILGFAQKLASIRAGGSRSGWDVGLDFARELGPTVFQPLLNIVNSAMLLRAHRRAQHLFRLPAHLRPRLLPSIRTPIPSKCGSTRRA
jgi:hypothetical protein